MRKIGDILTVVFGNEHYGKKCRIIGINKMKGCTTYDIELLDKQFNWKTGHCDLTFIFSDVHYCDLKENIN